MERAGRTGLLLDGHDGHEGFPHAVEREAAAGVQRGGVQRVQQPELQRAVLQGLQPDPPQTFGRFNGTTNSLAGHNSRDMEFGLRFEF